MVMNQLNKDASISRSMLGVPAHVNQELSEQESVEALETALASYGILENRSEKAKLLFMSGITTMRGLSIATPEEFVAIKQYNPDLIDDDFIKAIASSKPLVSNPMNSAGNVTRSISNC